MMDFDDLATLRRLNDELEPIRHDSGLQYDMSYAAMWWTDLADLLIENSTRIDFPGRAQQEERDYEGLREFHGSKLDDNPKYAAIMRIGAAIIAEAKTRTLDPNGHLNSLKVIRETFAFLSEFGLVPVREDIVEADYESSSVRLNLVLPTDPFSPAGLTILGGPDRTYVLDDILFMAGRPVPLLPEPAPPVTTEAEVRALFAATAAVLRQYGAEVLAGDAAALERLAAASLERERRSVAECERLYLAEHGHLPPGYDAAC